MSKYQWTQENVLLPVIASGGFALLLLLLAGRYALLVGVIVTGAAMVLWLVCLIADYGATIRRERQEDVDTGSETH